MTSTELGFQLLLANCYANIFLNPRQIEERAGRFHFLVCDDKLVVGNLNNHWALVVLVAFPSEEDQLEVLRSLSTTRTDRFQQAIGRVSAFGHVVIIDRCLRVDHWISPALRVFTPVEAQSGIEQALVAGFRQRDHID